MPRKLGICVNNINIQTEVKTSLVGSGINSLDLLVDKLRIEFEFIRLVHNLHNIVQIAKDTNSFLPDLSIKIDPKVIDFRNYWFQVLCNAVRLNKGNQQLLEIWSSNELCILRSSLLSLNMKEIKKGNWKNDLPALKNIMNIFLSESFGEMLKSSIYNY